MRKWLKDWLARRQRAKLVAESVALAKLPAGVADSRARAVETMLAGTQAQGRALRFMFCAGGDRNALRADLGDRRFFVAPGVSNPASKLGANWDLGPGVVAPTGGIGAAALAREFALAQLTPAQIERIRGTMTASPEVAEFVREHGGSEVKITHVTPSATFGTAVFDGNRRAFRIAREAAK